MSTNEKRGRGRPKKVVIAETIEAVESPISLEMDDMVEEEVHKAPSRPKRTKINGRRNILSVEAPPGTVGRWVVDNDHGYRISQLIDLGYKFLEDRYLKVGDVVTHNNRQSTSILSRQVNRTGEVAYFMVIDKDLYESYQDEKQEIVDDSERAMREDLRKDGNYGTFKQETKFEEPN